MFFILFHFLFQELADNKVDVPSDVLIQIFNTCVNNERLPESDLYYREILTKSPQPTLSEHTLVKLANLYISADRFDGQFIYQMQIISYDIFY